MKIGIELTGVPTRGTVEGQAKYAFYLARALLATAPEEEFVLFHNSFRRAVERDALAEALGTDRFDWVQTRLPGTDRSDRIADLTYRLWTREARRRGVEVFHGTSFLGLAGTPPPSVVTVHDIAGALFPFDHIPDPGRYRRRRLRAIAAAERVVVPSEHTRRDLLAYWRVPEEKVIVTPEGFIPPVPSSPEETSAFEEALPARYLLYVGSWRANKNVDRLLRAFALPASRHGEVALVLAGGGGEAERTRLRARGRDLGIDGRLRFVGHVTDAELDVCYRRAAGLVQPSLYEGFGLTVLEAMGRDCPVACSRAASLPEVAGKAALLFDPLDVAAMANAMERLLGDDALRHDLIARGRRRVEEFTWERTAERTRAAYGEAVRAASSASP